MQSAQANEQQAEINLGYTDVPAPFDGVVTARQVSIGQLVGATTPTTLSTIVQLDPIWVNFNASERDVLAVREFLAKQGKTDGDLLGTPVEVGLAEPRAAIRMPGKLDYVAPERRSVDRNAGRPCRSRQSQSCFAAGIFRAHPHSGQAASGSCLCPTSRSAATRAGRYVLVVNKDNIVEQRKVEPGQLVGDLRVIDQGLTKDDRVVVGGIMQAIPGQKVDAVPRTAAAAK